MIIRNGKKKGRNWLKNNSQLLGVYLLGLADIVYKLNFVESFAFGSLISAVDPVATLAIFQGNPFFLCMCIPILLCVSLSYYFSLSLVEYAGDLREFFQRRHRYCPDHTAWVYLVLLAQQCYMRLCIH